MCHFIQYNFPCGHVAAYKRVRVHFQAVPGTSCFLYKSCNFLDFQVVNMVTVSRPHYCDCCLDRMEYEITARYQKQYFNLVREAVQLNWTKSDIKGSLADIREVLRAELLDFRRVYG